MQSLLFKPDEQIHWPNGRVPRDEPECGFDNARCVKSGGEWWQVPLVVVTVVLVAIGAVVGGMGVKYYRHQKYEQKVMNMVWKLNWKELHVHEVTAYYRSTLSPDEQAEQEQLERSHRPWLHRRSGPW